MSIRGWSFSLAANPSPPAWLIMSACGEAAWGGGRWWSSKLCTRWHWDDSFHDSGHVNVLCLSDQPSESAQKIRLELTFSTWILTQDTQLVFNSNWHSTSSQVTHNWLSRKTWSSSKFAKPSPPTTRCFTVHACDRPGGEGLVARLVELLPQSIF